MLERRLLSTQNATPGRDGIASAGVVRATLSERTFAAVYDRVVGPLERGRVGAERARLCGAARGRVLDVGAGTGANLAHWPAGDLVSRVDACEPSEPMRRRLQRNVSNGAAAVPVSVHSVGIDGPFPDPPYDTIVCCLVLCTVPDPAAAAGALLDALAPDGRLLYLEHVVSPGFAGKLQRLGAPAWSRVAGGCRLDRETQAILRAAGWGITDRECFDVPAPTRQWVAGTAIRRTWGAMERTPPTPP